MTSYSNLLIKFSYIVFEVVVLLWFSKPIYSDEILNPKVTESQQIAISDSTKMHFYRALFLWSNTVRQALILLPTAQKEFGVNDGEYNDRIAQYKALFPETSIDEKLVKKEIVIEKYFRNSKNIIPSPEQIQKEYVDICAQLPGIAVPAMVDILPILSCKALLNSDIVRQICNEKSKEFQAEQENEWDSLKVKNLLKELTIHLDESECLVIDTKDSNCVVTVGEFNAFLVLQPNMKRRIEINKAREMFLYDLLRKRFSSEQAMNDKLFISNKVVESKYLHIENKLFDPSISRKNIKDEELMEVYNKYYNRFFSDRKIKKIDIIGSTDSLYIDSLYQSVKLAYVKKEPYQFSERKSLIYSLPWILSRSEDLPETFNAFIDTLRIQGICTINLQFGHFLCRVVADHRQLEIRPEQAMQKLRYLVLEERNRSGGKSDTQRAIEYYKLHPERYYTPDTLLTKTWLIPINRDTLENKKLQKITNKKEAHLFTYKSVLSCNLPSEIEKKLLLAHKDKQRDTTLIGPVQSRYGNWYFQVESVKKGGIKLPFDSVKSAILNDLQIQNFPLDSIVKTENGQKLVEREVLSMCYYDHFSNEVDSIPVKDMEKIIRNHSIDIPFKQGDTITEAQISEARMILVESRANAYQQRINAWIDSLSINKHVLEFVQKN